MRILIVRLGAFGDLIHTLPLAADLASCGHQVHWLCEDRWAPLIEGSPAIARVHKLPRAAWRERRPAPLRQLSRDLQAQRFDRVIDAQGLAKSAWWVLQACGRGRIGHRRPRAREGSFLLGGQRMPVDATHVIDQQRALGLAICRPSGPWRFPLPAHEAAHRWAEDWLAEQGLTRPWALNVGAGWPTKIWPEPQQQGWARAVLARGRRPLIFWGNKAERASAERLAQAVPEVLLAPDTPLPELGALLSRCGVLVSGDTGPLHLAFAHGTPCIGLFGPVPHERNGPRGTRHRCFQAPSEPWERKDVTKARMDQISVDTVVDTCMELAKENG